MGERVKDKQDTVALRERTARVLWMHVFMLYMYLPSNASCSLSMRT